MAYGIWPSHPKLKKEVQLRSINSQGNIPLTNITGLGEADDKEEKGVSAGDTET